MIYRKRLFEIPSTSIPQDPFLFDQVCNALRAAVWTWAEQPPDTTTWPDPDAIQDGRTLTIDPWDSPVNPMRRLLTVKLTEVRGEVTWTLIYSICVSEGGGVTVYEECNRNSISDASNEKESPDLTGFLVEFAPLDLDGMRASMTYTVAAEAKGRMLQLLRKDETQRRLPVVVISPMRSGETLLDARKLAHQLRGLAHVLRLKSDFWWTKEEFAHICFGGSVRLYHAGYRADDKPGEHRFWAADEIMPDPEAVARDIVERVLRDTLGLEWSSTNLESLVRERSDAQVDWRFQARLEQLRGSIKETEREEREKLFNDLVSELNSVRTERDDFEQLYRAAKAKADALEYTRNYGEPSPEEEPPDLFCRERPVSLSSQAYATYGSLDTALQKELGTKLLAKLAFEELGDQHTEPIKKCKGGICFVYPRKRGASGARVIYRVQDGVVQVLELYQNHDAYDAERDKGYDLADYDLAKFTLWRLAPDEI